MSVVPSHQLAAAVRATQQPAESDRIRSINSRPGVRDLLRLEKRRISRSLLQLARTSAELCGLAIGALLVTNLVACGGAPEVGESEWVQATPRRTTVWLDGDGLDEGSAYRLRQVGVDEVVVRRGSVRLTGGAPALRLNRAPEIAGMIPVGVALRVEELAADANGEMAAAMWGALAAELAGVKPAELILDLPEIAPGVGEFLVRLREAAGIPVTPIVTIEQLHSGAAAELSSAVGEVIVPVYGSEDLDLRGVGELSTLELADRLKPLAENDFRVRVAVVLRPRCEPAVGRWGDSLDVLCEEDVAEISTSSSLDRSFVFRKKVRWSGREWNVDERLAVRWIDAARLNFFLRETSRLIMPELAGWDLVPLPPLGVALGMDREMFITYLSGRGPEPDLGIRVERQGSSVRVVLSNNGPFASAVSSYANFVEVSVESGSVTSDQRGAFERVVLGTRRGGTWQASTSSGIDAVRFLEFFVAPKEEIRSGWVRLPSSRSRATIRWQVTLTSGEEIAGTTTTG